MRLFAATFAALALCAFQGGAAFAQAPAPTATAPAAATPPAPTRVANPALYVVKDADTTVYLFGTFHLLPPEVEWKSQLISAALDRSDVVRLEIADVGGAATQTEVQRLVMERGMAAPGTQILAGMPAADAALVERAFAATGVPRPAFDTMKPWLANLTIGVAMLQKMGFSPDNSVDKRIEAVAKAAGKPVDGFETPAEQIGFISNFSDEVQRAQLVAGARDFDRMQTELPRMLAAWERGDSDRIGRMMTSALRATPELGQALLTDRNRRWADWIASRMAQPGTVFIAVGAGHLAGGDSVQRFLRDKGLRATRVRNARGL